MAASGYINLLIVLLLHLPYLTVDFWDNTFFYHQQKSIVQERIHNIIVLSFLKMFKCDGQIKAKSTVKLQVKRYLTLAFFYNGTSSSQGNLNYFWKFKLKSVSTSWDQNFCSNFDYNFHYKLLFQPLNAFSGYCRSLQNKKVKDSIYFLAVTGQNQKFVLFPFIAHLAFWPNLTKSRNSGCFQNVTARSNMGQY